MKISRSSLFACGILAVLAVATASPSANLTAAGQAPNLSCISMPLPALNGVPGNATEAASGIRDLMASYLKTPSLKVVLLEAKLPSQAAEEAKQKGCEPLLLMTVTKKTGGGKLTQALGQAAGASAWYLPGGGTVGTAAARAAAAGGLHAAASIASSTKAKDELRLEYKLQSAAGKVRFGPSTARRKATADGEDLLTPAVAEAAEAIVTGKAVK